MRHLHNQWHNHNHRCNKKGHWIKECPTNEDPTFDPALADLPASLMSGQVGVTNLHEAKKRRFNDISGGMGDEGAAEGAAAGGAPGPGAGYDGAGYDD